MSNATPSTPSASGYFTRLWLRFLSIFASRPSRRCSMSLPELPVHNTPVLDHTTTNLSPDTYVSPSWQEDKQHWMRHPSLRRASMIREAARRNRSRTAASPAPDGSPSSEIRIYVQDWSSLELNMADFFDPHVASTEASDQGLPPSSPSSPILPTEQQSTDEIQDVSTTSTESEYSMPSIVLPDFDPYALPPLPELNTIEEEDEEEESTPVQVQVDSESPISPFYQPYQTNALSAVTGLLCDPTSFSFSPSTVLPDAPPSATTEPAPSPKAVKTSNNRRDTTPYPDIFSFSVYFSRDSVYESELLPSATFTAEGTLEDVCGPISIYDVANERNRYRSAAYSSCISSSPKRQPLASTINAGSVSAKELKGKKPVVAATSESTSEASMDSIGAHLLAACDELSGCEWTEEFLRMFTSSRKGVVY
ncbi:hypothetical protein FB45DRAFT_904614 [Roridomyces roridus]|uniref:Uncharacterized protein n=1 Tax=Roridomyces roridus TaxID=1738132 RepID=A0AAD7FUV4_9AGAR|nr:hypothetical protein FB45DRAFT_904614 [Roridomyces roridus]